MTLALSTFADWIPVLIAIGVTIVLVILERFIISRFRANDPSASRFQQQIWTVIIVICGLLAVIFVLPEEANQDLAIGIIGLVVTGALAISSQSIIANGMAGLLVRSLGSFNIGDFIEIDNNLGRVSEMGLFHTEIQTPDRDLTTIPNSLLMNTPVKVVRKSGTIVSANVSIGYDVSRHELEVLFAAAAEAAGLAEPFVQVVELGDYTVNYRVAGFLPEPKRLLAARSKLRAAILDTLHAAEVEIMSPHIIARREISDKAVLPSGMAPRPTGVERRTAEDRVFDKAELASGIESQRDKLTDHREAISRLQESRAGLTGEDLAKVDSQIAIHERRLEALNFRIEHLAALLSADE